MEKQKNPIKEWWYNIKHTKQNYKKVKASPYASLVFSLKVRKMVLVPIMILIAWRGFNMVMNIKGSSFMDIFQRVFTIGILVYLLYRIYKTIPDAKKQIAYYRKYPHVINYCPTNVKEDVDDILEKIKQNQLNSQEVKKDVPKKEKGSGKEGSSRGSKAKRN